MSESSGSRPASSFLRDVLVQFVGTVLAAGFIYLWALALGYFRKPGDRSFGVMLVAVIIEICLLAAGVYFGNRTSKGDRRKSLIFIAIAGALLPLSGFIAGRLR